MNDNSAPTEGLNTMPPVVDELADPLEADWFSDEADFNVPVRGTIRNGTIASVSRGEILIDIGAKSEGVIASREMESMSREARSRLSVGDEVEVYVVNPEDRDGNIILSIARAEEEIDWRWAESLLESQEVLEGEISGYNKGGLLVQMRRVRGFVPASQLDNIRRDIRYGSSPDERWAHMVGEQIQAKVIEVDRSRNRLILSERAAMKEWREAQKDRLLEELQEGEVRDGRVINLADFGAFVDLGGADGLVHLSELSWKRVAHPREVVNVGDEVKVYVLNVDRERRRIGLSLKRLEPDPWMTIEQTFQVGTLVEGTVTKLTKFGAFARLTGLDDIEGLIHISELSEEHIEHPSEVVSEGQMVTMRVIRIEAQRRRLGLSIKRVDSDEYADADWSDAAVSDTWSSDEESE
ncbi:MAG: S1 RNA-binding domain-containing protein [Ardenticatenales bacterium]|nr:S1 RNA-binding domain-containing protein [Ardenticatenales bacterium]